MGNEGSHRFYSFSSTGLFTLIRPVNTLLTGFAVLLGIYLGEMDVPVLILICGPLSAMFVAAGGYVDNDIADLRADSINCPSRPLPSGSVPINIAMLTALGCFVAGLVLAGICSPVALPAAGVAAFVVVGYNHVAKRGVIIGNVMVSIAGGFPFLYAGLLGTSQEVNWTLLWVAFGLAAMLHLVRELLKDIEDMAGDRDAGFHTAAILWGRGTTQRLAGTVALITGTLVVLPGIRGWLNMYYLIGAVVFVSIPCLFLGVRSFTGMHPDETSRWSTVMKIIMILGLLLLLIGKP